MIAWPDPDSRFAIRRSFEFAFLLPVCIEKCDVPNIRLDETTTLRSFQWIELYESDDKAFKKFVNGIWKQWRRKNA